jgi:hypothetical protein
MHSVGLGAAVCWEFSWEASSWFGFVDFVWETMKSMGEGGSCNDVVGPLIIRRRT